MKKIQTLTIAAAVLAMTGCIKETIIDPNTPDGQFGEATMVDFTLTAPALTRGVTGDKEAASNDENRITMLEFYVFDETGNVLDPAVKAGDGAPEGYFKVVPAQGQTSVPLVQKFKVSASTNGQPKKMIVVANTDLGPTADAMNTYDEVRSALSKKEMLKSTDPANNVRAIPQAGLEMSGSTAAVITAGRGDNAVTISITRLVNKINQPIFDGDKATTAIEPVAVVLTQEEANAVWGFTDATQTTPKVDVATASIAFESTGYVLINGLSRSNVGFTGNASGNYKEPQITASVWDTWSTTGKVYQASEFDADNNYTNVYSGKYGQGFFLDGSAGPVYAFENKPRTITMNNLSGYDADQVYSFVIEGKLTANGTLTETRFWRVNLTKDNNYHMMRNMVYKTFITAVNTPGYKTAKDAEDSIDVVPEPGETAMQVTVDIAQWDVNEYATEM